MHGDPSTCNALHVPSIEGEIDCADWKLNEAIAGGLTPDGLYLRERLDQGQVPIAEIIQRRRSEQVERWREAFERGDPFIVIIITLGILKADFPKNLDET